MTPEYATFGLVIFVLSMVVVMAYVDLGIGHINVANMIQPGTWSPDGREDHEEYYRRHSWRR